MVFGMSSSVVFLILAALYESWSLPFSVLLSVPVAVLGAYAGLLLRKFDNNVFAQIGLVMLIGLDGQECHPDRRVCDLGALQSTRNLWKPHSKEPACG